MLFQQVFSSLRGNTVIVETKNNCIIKGTLQSVDKYLNLKLIEIEVINIKDFPQLPRVTSTFIRGSSVRYVHLPPESVDLKKLHQSTTAHNSQNVIRRFVK